MGGVDSFSALGVVSMLVLVPAGLGGAWAGVTRRDRLAALLFGIAAVVLLPYVWVVFALPEV